MEQAEIFYLVIWMIFYPQIFVKILIVLKKLFGSETQIFSLFCLLFY